MRLSVISHSLIARRQAIFFNYLNSLEDVDVQQIYPRQWRHHTRKGGFIVGDEGNMMCYYFGNDAFRAIKRFRPDILYIQNEMDCYMTLVAKRWAERLGCKFAVFVWQNIGPIEILETDLIVAGNCEAGELHHTDVIIPQVGVSAELFAPRKLPKIYDLIFMGRHTTGKGVHVIERAVKNLDIKVCWSQKNRFVSYDALSGRYSRAKIHLAPSIDMPFWKEQFNYTVVESLLCTLYNIISDTKAMVEWFGKAPGLKVVEQNNPKQLREAIIEMLSQEWKPNLQGREWAKSRFSKEVVGEELLKVFKNL